MWIYPTARGGVLKKAFQVRIAKAGALCDIGIFKVSLVSKQRIVCLFLGSIYNSSRYALINCQLCFFFLFHIKRSGRPFRENNYLQLSSAVSGRLNILMPSSMLLVSAWWNLLKGMLVLFSKFITYAHRMSSFTFWILNNILNFSRFATFYCRKELKLTVLSRIKPRWLILEDVST